MHRGVTCLNSNLVIPLPLCRGAKQISYNYNYGQFSTFVGGEAGWLLQNPQLVSTTWLALASAVWFFLMPQPPKPSMLDVSFLHSIFVLTCIFRD